MADTTVTKSVLKLVATTSSKIRNLTIESGQLIFLYDVGRLAFDYKDKRVFYNQIVEIQTEAERQSLEDPLDGYYFVLGSGCLWAYRNGWAPITGRPESIEFIGVELPELGQENKLYVSTTEGSENISVWNEELGTYVIVADKTQSITSDEVDALFN